MGRLLVQVAFPLAKYPSLQPPRRATAPTPTASQTCWQSREPRLRNLKSEELQGLARKWEELHMEQPEASWPTATRTRTDIRCLSTPRCRPEAPSSAKPSQAPTTQPQEPAADLQAPCTEPTTALHTWLQASAQPSVASKTSSEATFKLMTGMAKL